MTTVHELLNLTDYPWCYPYAMLGRSFLTLASGCLTFLIFSSLFRLTDTTDWQSYKAFPRFLTSSHNRFHHSPYNMLSTEELAKEYEIERRRVLHAKKYKPFWTSTFQPKAYPMSSSHQNYVARLQGLVDQQFNGSPFQSHLDEMLRRLLLHIPPPLLDQPTPKIVASTCKGGWEKVWDQFRTWKDKLEPDGWVTYVADDKDMEDWVAHLLAGTGDGIHSLYQMWNKLPKPVLKTDFLR